ncbi:glucokinase [Sulfuricurvum sp.]|uniref:glucokinase n=1 Tax=Sulfuricurvum sp. TaxID=2025608 RepID=UPI002613E83F|nr:glucokinase [Sulfuricurvum sp.]MDD2781116.1 glucokinase [Sulfuricurvum sp.]
MILAGDIGGTKTSLALFEIQENALELYAQYQFSSQAYTNFSDIIREFMQMFPDACITSSSFGIAGPIIDERCQTTNLPWDISAVNLRELLGVDQVYLLNDLEATAYGMLHLEDSAFVDLNPDAKPARGNCAVIAAGTGLGEAILYFDGKNYHPIASEGGHCDFAPLTPQQDALLLWLRQRFPEHVSLERILSGPGVSTLYDYLRESGFAAESDLLNNIGENEDKSALISKAAFEENDPLCVETLRLFSEIYGAEAGNLALKCLCVGGVYLGGGIAPKILPFLQTDTFFRAFISKGRFEPMLRQIPIKVSLNPETALLGAAHFSNKS